MGSFVNDGVDDVLCGCLTIGFAGSFLVVYVIILLLFKRRHDIFSAPIYKQMFNMGITDCIQLSLHVVGGICSLAQYEMPPDINMVLGGFANAAWFSWIIFSFSVAFNRFISFCYQKQYTVFYGNRLLQTQIGICWIVMLVMLVIYCSPYCSIRYYRYQFSWRYDHTTPGEPVIARFEFFYVSILLIFSGISYMSIFIKILSMREKSNTLYGKRHEVRVLIQASCVCLYTILSQIHWQFYYMYMPHNRYSLFSCNMAWILNSGMTPILCLTVNKTVQRAFFRFLHVATLKSSVAAIPTVPTLTSSRRRE